MGARSLVCNDFVHQYACPCPQICHDVQVFFYFAGHGACLRQDQCMFGVDGEAVFLMDYFDRHVTSTGAPVVAILDCCRKFPEAEVSEACTRTAELVCSPRVYQHSVVLHCSCMVDKQ